MRKFDIYLESFLLSISSFCYRRSYFILFIFFVLTVSTLYFSSLVHVDMSTASTLGKEEKIRVEYEEFKSIFGRNDGLIISFPLNKSLKDKDIETLRYIHNSLITIEYISSVKSILNVNYIYSNNDQIYIEDMIEKSSNNSKDLNYIYKIFTEDINYKDKFISPDGNFTSVFVKFKAYSKGALVSDQKISDTIELIKKELSEINDYRLYISGEPVILSELNRLTSSDAVRSTLLSLVGLFFVLILFFRRFLITLIPLFIVTLSILSGLSLMVYNDRPFTVTTNTMMPIILAVGVADSLHILVHFFYYFDKEKFSKKDAVLKSVVNSAPAIIFTSLTTAGAFLSFTNSDLVTFSDLGIYSSACVMFALIFTVIFIPSVLSALPIRRRYEASDNFKKIDALIYRLSLFVSRNPKYIAGFSFGILFFTLSVNFEKIDFSNDIISYFPDHSQVKNDLNVVDDAFNGVSTFEVIIDTKVNGGIFKNNFFNKLESLLSGIDKESFGGVEINDTYSLVDVIRQMNRALNGNDLSSYIVPESQNLISQELLLFQMGDSDAYNELTDINNRISRVTIKVDYRDSTEYQSFIKIISDKFERKFPAYNVTVTGSSAIASQSVPLALNDMIKGTIISLFIISILMGIATNSLKLGLISMMPNILPLSCALFLMKIFNWSFDLTTAMVGAIALGIIVDDTLHFLYSFKYNLNYLKDVRKAIHASISYVGKALILTTLVIIIVFGINVTSSMNNVVIFSILLVCISLMALLSNLLFTPALLLLFYKKRYKYE